MQLKIKKIIYMVILNLWALRDLHERFWYSFAGKIKLKRFPRKIYELIDKKALLKSF